MDVDGRIHWFSPDPRAILPLGSFHASKTLLQTCRSGRFEWRINHAFEDVMRSCADRSEGTWISEEICRAYLRLHELGIAHSVECWKDGTLVGGLYGVAIGGAFFGESMFHRVRDASKVALVRLVEHMTDRGYTLLDLQWLTPHLERFGAIAVPRSEYLQRLFKAIRLRRRFT